MRSSKLVVAIVMSVVLGACASWSGGDVDKRMFGKHAKMREIAGDVISAGTNGWGLRYIVVKDVATGLRVYVLSDAQACVPGKPFKATGHLTRTEDVDYDATFHGHLADGDCG